MEKQAVLAFLLMLHYSFNICLSLNSEGLALLKFKERVKSDPYGALSSWNGADVEAADHCSWFGVECLEGRIIGLSLKDLCLEGTLAPELGTLAYIKSITMRDNNFQGNIPREILELKQLQVLDLGCNNFTGDGIDNNLSLSIFLGDNNNCLSKRTSCNRKSIAWDTIQDTNAGEMRRLMLEVPNSQNTPLNGENNSNSQNKETKFPIPSQVVSVPSPSPSFAPAPRESIIVSKPNSPDSNKHHVILWALLVFTSLFLLFLCALSIFLCRSDKMVLIKPCSFRLSRNQQKTAFVIGVPKLQRSELEIACEDFSNIIGSITNGTIYRGTLSSGVEIAVTTTAVKSAEFWSKTSQAHFKNKIEVLSSVNHNNFVNLIGYCEEEKPFTRMMVFEYAPNGTLFEHLYIKESEHLDWGSRIRIATGIANCLDHMHGLTPPLALNNLHSSSIFLTEDYNAKISDFTFWNEMTAIKMGSPTTKLLETSSNTDPQSNIYSLGVILFELITGKIPYSVNNELGNDWAEDYLKQLPALREIVDPSLNFVPEEEFDKIREVIKSCVNSDIKLRPNMKEVAVKLREIMEMGINRGPKLSPLWWAELEILSSEAS